MTQKAAVRNKADPPRGRLAAFALVLDSFKRLKTVGCLRAEGSVPNAWCAGWFSREGEETNKEDGDGCRGVQIELALERPSVDSLTSESNLRELAQQFVIFLLHLCSPPSTTHRPSLPKHCLEQVKPQQFDIPILWR